MLYLKCYIERLYVSIYSINISAFTNRSISQWASTHIKTHQQSLLITTLRSSLNLADLFKLNVHYIIVTILIYIY